MTTKRELILDALGTALATISIANDYLTDVELVEPVLKAWDEVNSGKMPWIGFATDPNVGTQFAPQPNRRYACELGVVIMAHVLAKPGDEKNSALSNIQYDILKCLNDNYTLSGNCRDIVIVSDETDEADSILYPDKPVGTLVQHWTIKYFQDTRT